MLQSLGWMVLVGFILAGLFQKFKLPGLIGMMIAGMILGPYGFNLLSDKILIISPELRQIALIVILLRAGLNLDLKDLKQIGRPAFLMSFVPATFEILTIILIATIVFKISILEAALLGSVLAAVSPAVVVPRMIHLKQMNKGQKHKLPQMIMAAASVDDIFVIVLFTSFIGLLKGQTFNLNILYELPLSLLTGIVCGFGFAYLLTVMFKRIHIRDTIKVMILFSLSFFLVGFETEINTLFPFSGLIAVMTLGMGLQAFYPILASRLLGKFAKIWVGAELFLFILVGAVVNLKVLTSITLIGLVVIIVALFGRMIGVQMCLIKTPLNIKERLFTSIAFLPKATVQAAIGSIALSQGLAVGELILSLAVLSILFSAPLGAIGIDLSTNILLEE